MSASIAECCCVRDVCVACLRARFVEDYNTATFPHEKCGCAAQRVHHELWRPETRAAASQVL